MGQTIKIIYKGASRDGLEPDTVYTAKETELGYEVRMADKTLGVLHDEALLLYDKARLAAEAYQNRKDPINPSHYTGGGIEVWEMMVKLFGEEDFCTYCEINAFKYRMRAGKKEGNSAEQDIKKALWYEGKLEEIKRKNNLDNAFE